MGRHDAGRSIEGGLDETPTPLPHERAPRLDRDRGPRAPAPRPGGVRAFGRPRRPDDPRPVGRRGEGRLGGGRGRDAGARWARPEARGRRDRKSTRLNSSHLVISYAVFCLKKKKKKKCMIETEWLRYVT